MAHVEWQLGGRGVPKHRQRRRSSQSIHSVAGITHRLNLQACAACSDGVWHRSGDGKYLCGHVTIRLSPHVDPEPAGIPVLIAPRNVPPLPTMSEYGFVEDWHGKAMPQ